MTELVPSPLEKYSPQEILRLSRLKLAETMRDAYGEEEARLISQKMLLAERQLLCKRYDMPHGFGSYDVFARLCVISMYYVITEMTHGARDPHMGGQLHMYETFKHWVDHGQPLLTCTPELGRALLNTEPPDNLTYQDIRWPFHSWTVALPLGLINTISGAPITYVMVKIIDASNRPEREPTEEELEMMRTGLYEDGRGKNLFEVVLCSEVEVYWRSLRPLNAQPMREFMKMPDGVTNHWSSWELSSTEEQIADRVIYFVTSLAMFLSGQPDDMLAERLIKTIKPPKAVRTLDTTVGRDELWSPNIVGRRYTDGLTAAERDAHTRHMARTHWRRGHWRAQRHGQGFSLVKVLWIKPTLVNTGDE